MSWKPEASRMLGWHISVYRVHHPEYIRDALVRADFDLLHGVNPPKENRIAVWQTGLGGLDWLDSVVRDGRGVRLMGSGYPARYLARAGDLIPQIEEGPPDAYATWLSGPHDVLGPGWEGKTTLDETALVSCDAEEWLYVQVWDES